MFSRSTTDHFIFTRCPDRYSNDLYVTKIFLDCKQLRNILYLRTEYLVLRSISIILPFSDSYSEEEILRVDSRLVHSINGPLVVISTLSSSRRRILPL